jgi:hypothetical protein
MNNETIAKLLKEIVNLAEQTAIETANLINNGDPLIAPSKESGSLMRANDLRGTAKALRKTFDNAIGC